MKHVILDPPHSLDMQSYNPKELLKGSLNEDGFEYGRYTQEISQSPGIYINLQTLWTDKIFQCLSKLISSALFLAPMRNAKPSSPADQRIIQSFMKCPYSFIYNGYIEKYYRKRKYSLHILISDDLCRTLYSHSDSAAIFMLPFDNLRQNTPTLEHMVEAVFKIIGLITKNAEHQ